MTSFSGKSLKNITKIGYFRLETNELSIDSYISKIISKKQ